MKVLEQTDRRLTFRTSPVPSLVFAVICLLFGSIAIGVARGGAFADRDHPGATSTAGRVSYALGGVLVTTGIALAIFVVGTITCTFARDADTVTLLRKRLVGTRSETFALQDVDRAEIEEQRSN